MTTAGRLIVSTLDPFYHHGSNFMPATTRFLDGFLPWARKRRAPERIRLDVWPLETSEGSVRAETVQRHDRR